MSGFNYNDSSGQVETWESVDGRTIIVRLFEEEFELLHDGDTIKKGTWDQVCQYYWAEFA